MDITLYQAAADVRALFDQIDVETGEMPEGFEEARELVARKATAVAAYILESGKQADMVEAAGKELVDRAKAQRKRIDWLKQYLQTHMAASGVTEITEERGLFKAKLERERDEAIEVFDAAQVPQDYQREIPAKYEPDKALIKRAIKDGFDVPGAKLVKRDRLTIK
jgi:hypothetical protein